MVLRESVSSERAETIDVSVCIANYNGAHVIRDCIDSVLAQTADLTVEIIVHDDASTDESVEIIERHYAERVRLITSSTNTGFCISNNRMATAARGRYILLLNNDAALFPDALEKLLHHAQYTRGILTLPQYDWETADLVDRGCLLDPFYNPVPNKDINRIDVAMVIGACLWIPRELWSQLGGFPDWIESIGEDLFLCCKARAYGHPVQCLNQSGYRHRQGYSFGGNKVRSNRLSSSIKRRRLSERNKTFVMCIYTPAPILLALFPVHALLLLLEGAVMTAAMRKPSILLAVYINAIFASIRKRSLLQRERRALPLPPARNRMAYLQGLTWFPRKLEMIYRYGIPKLK